MDQSTDLSFNFWQFLLAPPNSHWQLELYLPTTDHQGELEWMPLVESKNHLRNIPSCKKQNKNNHPLIATCFFHQLLKPSRNKRCARGIFFECRHCVSFCVGCIYELRLAGWDWESEMKHPKFQPRLSIFPSSCPWQNVADVFSRIRTKNNLKQVIRYNPGWIFAFTWNNSSHFLGGFPSPKNTDLLEHPIFLSVTLRKCLKLYGCEMSIKDRKLQTTNVYKHLLLFWSKQRAKRSWKPKRVIWLAIYSHHLICFSGIFLLKNDPNANVGNSNKTPPFDCPALGWKMSSLGRSCKTSNVNFGTAGNLQNASESTLESIDVPKGDGSCFDELGLYEETNPSYQGKSHPSKISWPSFCLAKKLVAATKQAPPEHGENTEKTKMSWNHAIHLRYGFKQLPGLKRKDPDPTSPAVFEKCLLAGSPVKKHCVPLGMDGWSNLTPYVKGLIPQPKMQGTGEGWHPLF